MRAPLAARGVRVAALLLAAAALGGAGPVRAADEVLGILEWQGYPQQYRWRLEWDPVARYGEGSWSALPPGDHPPVGAVFAPGGMGVLYPEAWVASTYACDSLTVAVGRWEPGTVPVDQPLDRPVAGTTGESWPRWPLNDPAEVWHTPGRPAELAGALAGLSRDARREMARNLPPGLEIDPEVPLIRRNLRLAEAWEPGALELVGEYQGAVRLRGGGASSEAVLHVWVSATAGRRIFRYALLDLPRAGAARLSRTLIGVVRPPGTERPAVILRESAEAGRRVVILELLDGGRFRPSLETPWEGCSGE